MELFRKVLMILGICATFSLAADVQNIQFKDMKGNSYDLYEVLARGTYVYVEMIFNT